MLRSHWTGFLLPILLGLIVAFVALFSVGVPMALLLSLFGTDPLSSFYFVIMTDKPTLAGVTGAAGVTLAMWLGHLASRTQSWVSWFAWGVAGYAFAALAIWTLVPQTVPAG
ncbi:MAG: hypothetical protein QM698_06210 [Micropepsaceae bacterium]